RRRRRSPGPTTISSCPLSRRLRAAVQRLPAGRRGRLSRATHDARIATMAASRVVASIAAAGAAIRTRIDLERGDVTRKIRDVKVPDVWAALAELGLVRSLHEDEGAQSLALSVDETVVNRALATTAGKRLLADNRLRAVDVEFSPDGIVIGV